MISRDFCTQISWARRLNQAEKVLLSALLCLLGLLGSVDPVCAQGGSQYERNAGKDRVIVFVHGIFGSRDETWKRAGGDSWPHMLLSDHAFDDSDVYVVGYETPYFGNRMSIDEVVTNLKNRLDSEKVLDDHKEVVFVCHSLGGLIVQRYLVTYRQAPPVADKTIPFIYFFSTPQTGAQIAQLGKVFSEDPLLKQMLPGDQNDYLLNLETEWKAAKFRNAIHRLCAYEKKPTAIVRGFWRFLSPPILIVDQLSATRSCDEPGLPINEDHINIVKPFGTRHDSYIALRNAVERHPIGRSQLAVDPLKLTFDGNNTAELNLENKGSADLSWSITHPQQFLCQVKGFLSPTKREKVIVGRLAENIRRQDLDNLFLTVKVEDTGQSVRVPLKVNTRRVDAYDVFEKSLHDGAASGEMPVRDALAFSEQALAGAPSYAQTFLAGQLLFNAGIYGGASDVLDGPALVHSDFASDSVYQRYRALAIVQQGDTSSAVRLFREAAGRSKGFSFDDDTAYAAAVTFGRSGDLGLAREQLARLGLKASYDPTRLERPDVKASVSGELQKMVVAAARMLDEDPAFLRSNVFLLGDDGLLRIPNGFHHNMTTPLELTVGIPVGSGATGCAFQQARFTITDLRSHDLWTRTREQKDWEECPEWRRALLPASEMSKVNPRLTWIASVPIVNMRSVPVGVLNLDSTGTKGDGTTLQALKPLMTATAQKIASIVLKGSR